MKNSKKGVFYAIMAILGLSGASANADIFSDMGKGIGTAATKGYDWAKAHPEAAAGIAAGVAAATAAGAGAYYGGKKLTQQKETPFVTISDIERQKALEHYKEALEGKHGAGRPIQWYQAGPGIRFKPVQPAPEKSWIDLGAKMISEQNQ